MSQTHNVSRLFKYLNQMEATNLDIELFNEYKFSVDQLMELAGLSVAAAVYKMFPPIVSKKGSRVLVVCGPGNNGGDGLVAARHLKLFGYEASILYPKRTPKPLYENLLTQCHKFGVEVLEICPDQQALDERYTVIVDALFGFSFKPPVREEMAPILNAMINATIPVVSVDIPSGWDVNNGPMTRPYLKPKLLVSLSAPKMCAKYLQKETKHYLGGRFIPWDLQEKYGITLMAYRGVNQIVEYEDSDLRIPANIYGYE